MPTLIVLIMIVGGLFCIVAFMEEKQKAKERREQALKERLEQEQKKQKELEEYQKKQNELLNLELAVREKRFRERYGCSSQELESKLCDIANVTPLAKKLTDLPVRPLVVRYVHKDKSLELTYQKTDVLRAELANCVLERNIQIDAFINYSVIPCGFTNKNSLGFTVDPNKLIVSKFLRAILACSPVLQQLYSVHGTEMRMNNTKE